MGRPCTCDRVPPAGQPYTTDFCRLCWLWHYDSSYRIAWGNEKDANVHEVVRCPHLKRRARDAEGKVKKHWCEAG